MTFNREDWNRRKAGWEEDTLAYTAGFLDGEGCFWVGRGWKIGVSCANTDLSVIRWLQNNFGGSIFKPRPLRKPNHRPVWTWQVVGHSARELCAYVTPYLREKAPQALLLVSLSQLMGLPLKGRYIDPEVIEERDRLTEILKGMKHRVSRP